MDLQATREEVIAPGLLDRIRFRLAEQVFAPGDLDHYLRSIFQALHEIVPSGTEEGLVLYDPHKDVVSFPYLTIPDMEQTPQARSALQHPLADVIESGESLYLPRGEYQDRIRTGRYLEREDLPAVWMGIPLLLQQQPAAVLLFESPYNNSYVLLSAEILQALEDLAPSLAQSLDAKLRLISLTESERKFRNFIEASTDITFQITRTGYIDFVSANVRELFGCDPDGLVGKHFKVTTPMDQVSKVIQALKGITSGETIRNLEIIQQIGDGVQVPMEVNATPVYRGNRVVGASGVMRDISDRNQARREIERLANFPMANPMPVVEVDFYGTPSYINPAGIELLDRMQLDMSQVSRILPKAYRQHIREAISQNTGIAAQEVNLRDLKLLWSAHFIDNQNLIHYYATDITPLKETERELIKAKEKAIQGERVKSLFLANMSHEIRTPLNSILGFTELVEQAVREHVDPDTASYFDIIQNSGKRLWRTVHEILDISQIETDTFELKIEELDLARILHDLVAAERPLAEAKNLDFQVEIPEGSYPIEADEYCLTQSFSNLINNAIKYTPEGHVRLGLNQAGPQLEVIVEDTGIGMSQDYQDRMFDPFSQESTGYTKEFQGVGLGLALTKRYLDLVGADLKLESRKDEGSIFRVQLQSGPPQTRTERAVSNTGQGQTALQGGRSHILVVEDDANSQQLVKFTLQKVFDLSFAASVAQAKQRLEANPVNLILLDLSLMGDEDGLDLARYLRSTEVYRELPVIALTAHAFTTDRDRCLEAGCNDFVTKPFRRKELLEKISSFIVTETVVDSGPQG